MTSKASKASKASRPTGLLATLGPGLLVAATGVGAGDLLTASLGGSAVGVSIVWAALAGAVLKWVLNEGIARWQMATSTTLLEGWVERLGPWIQWVFLVYLVGWTFFTGGALITACGVAGTGLLPLAADPVRSKIYWGIVHSAAGVVLVRLGGFRLFQWLMSLFIAVMFVAVVCTGALVGPDWGQVAAGLVPSIPAGGLGWVLGILGGVGGTVTLLSYGYWIREQGRSGASGVRACRIDLAVSYTLTALFGVCMVIIGSTVELAGGGVRVAPLLADRAAQVMGPAGRVLFLVGFWGAVFSSLLGVWQSVPYMFADFLTLRRGSSREQRAGTDFTKTGAYRAYLVCIAVLPLPVLFISVKQAQLAYAVLGSVFMPLLALTLLIMNNRREWVGKELRSHPALNALLVLTLGFFGFAGYRTAAAKLRLLLR